MGGGTGPGAGPGAGPDVVTHLRSDAMLAQACRRDRERGMAVACAAFVPVIRNGGGAADPTAAGRSRRIPAGRRRGYRQMRYNPK